jgi:hypothetical protein
MGQQLSLEDLRRAWTARDPELPSLFIALVAAADSESAAPVREGALTFTAYLSELRGYNHRKRRSPQERARYRIDGMRALEAQRAEVPLPERLGAYELLEELWRAAQVTGAAYAREALLEIIAGVPLRWGPWRALKRIFKEAEARGDTEIVGALAARFDAAYAQRYGWGTSEVSKNTIGYLCRRAWRYLRRQAEGLGAAYADAAVEFLRFYPERVDLRGTWVYNHILHHETKKYTRRNFKRIDRGASALKSAPTASCGAAPRGPCSPCSSAPTTSRSASSPVPPSRPTSAPPARGRGAVGRPPDRRRLGDRRRLS